MAKTQSQNDSVNSEFESFRKIWHLMGDQRRDIVFAMIFRVLQSVSLGAAFGAAYWVIRDVSGGREVTTSWAWQITGLMVLSLLGQLLFSFLSVRQAWQSSYRVCGSVRLGILEHLKKLPMGFHLTRETGDLANVLSGDVQMVESFLSEGLAKLVQAVALPMFVFTFLLFQDWRIALVMMVPIVVGLLILVRVSRRMAILSRDRQNMQGETAARMIEFVLGMKVIRAFGQLDQGFASLKQAMQGFLNISIRMVHDQVAPLMVFIIALMLGVPLVFFVTGLNLSTMNTGNTIAVLVLVFPMYAPVVALASAMESMRIADGSLMRIDRVLNETALPESTISVAPKGYEIVAKNVGFHYETGGRVLDDISFVVPERTTTAIVGPSGSGKSTILNLIARFWDSVEGEILIGGAPIKDLTTEQLNELVSFVFQDVFLFSGSIYDNIALGRPGADENEIIEAAKLAQAHDFVSALPNGYQADVGEGGANLSGGERQRVAIARAILKGAPIVLLDEATAAVDPINEKALQTALNNLVADRTLIIVAHKLGTIRHADQILVLQNGHIVEAGNHDDLIKNNTLYTQLFERKTAAEGWHLST